MKNDTLNNFLRKADEYFSTANSNSITYHDTKVNELLKIAKNIYPDIISLYFDSNLNENHKLVVLHILDRLEYQWRTSRKEIPYNVESLKKVFLQSLNHEYEALRFQAIKCSSIAEAIARKDKSFGDYYFDKLYDALSDQSSRVRANTLFLLSCNAPDSKNRIIKNVDPIKKILNEGEREEYFQALQYMKGKDALYPALKHELLKRLNSYDGTHDLYYPEVFVKSLSKDEILSFVNQAIKIQSVYSLKSVIMILALNVYSEIIDLCKDQLSIWYNNFPSLRALIIDTCTKLDIALESIEGNKINDLPDNEFLQIVSNKRVEGTLARIINIFSSNTILIYRGDGGFEILSALSFYKQDDFIEFIGIIPDKILDDILFYCKKD